MASFLSYVDYYRPRFVIMENVKQLASNSKGLMLELVLSALVRMCYQVAFTVLQVKKNMSCHNYCMSCFLVN